MSEIELKYPALLKASIEHPYDENVCFLCASDLNDNNRTKEHVIPKWAQEKYDLREKRLVLLNGTKIKYRHLTIPCCKKCNSNYSILEDKIKRAVEIGVDAVRGLPRFLLFKWLAKIFLGILYKEIFLRNDIKNPKSESIVDYEYLKKNFSILHFWLQTSYKYDNESFALGSIFIFETAINDNINDQFDFLDNPEHRTLAIRLGGVGLVGDFLENGIHFEATKNSILPNFENHIYDPIQFREIVSKIFYKAYLLEVNTELNFTVKDDGSLQCFLKYEIVSGDDDNMFHEWHQRQYAQFLSFYLGIPFEEIFRPPNYVLSWIPWDNEE
jgi:hypothetical protein